MVTQDKMEQTDPECDQEDHFFPELFLDKNYSSQPISVGNVTLEMRALHQAASTDFDLTGQVVWPASKLLAMYLMEHPEVLHNKRVLELGAGVGLSGLVAGKLSDHPSNVVITDHQEEVLKVLRENVLINNQGKEQPQCAALCWGKDLDSFKDTYGTFDVILGADVVFGSGCSDTLLETVSYLLSNKSDSVFLIAFIVRSQYSEEQLRSSAEKHRLTMMPIDISFTKKYDFTDSDFAIAKMWLMQRTT